MATMPTESSQTFKNEAVYSINSEAGLTDGKKSSNKLQKIFTVLTAVFLLTTILFLVLFAVYYNKYKDKASAQGRVCMTTDCIQAASSIIQKMDPKIDPCQDFSEYACGTFIREAILPEGEDYTSIDQILGDKNKLIMKEILQENIKEEDAAYVNNIKKLFKSCLDEAKIESVGLGGYWSDPMVADWPTLTPTWSDANFDLNALIIKYEKLYIEPLFSYDVILDPRDSSKRVIKFSEPSQDSQGWSQEYFSEPRKNHDIIMAYEKYLAEFAVALNASRATAEADAKEVVDLVIKLSTIMVPGEERRDSSEEYNVVYLNNLTSLYPKIDIARALKEAFQTANVTLAENEELINNNPTYLGNLSLVLSTVSNRTIQNLFGFNYAFSKVANLTRRLREIKLGFDRVNSGTEAEQPRWEVCLDYTSEVFLKGVSKKFIDKTMSKETKTYITDMFEKIQEEFRKMISENSWLSQKTKDEALKKLAAIKKVAGYPDVDFSDSDINKYYENYTMTEDNYFQNRALWKQLSAINKLLSLRKPVDENEFEWTDASFEANAVYYAGSNEIVIFAGFLQPPYFSPTFQDSMNYGGIGTTIGHEFTHGFDDDGSKYDGDGKLRNWWQQNDRDKFLQRTQCIVDQNSNFFVADINMTLNGNETLGESISDNGGLKQSFRAYKELVRIKGESPTLPGLNLTQDQLFFLSFAQTNCEKMNRDGWKHQITTGVHPPDKYRILGPLQNSEDFAKAYSCPQTSYMNPAKKCTVW